MTKDEAHEKLTELAALAAGWDGYGSKVISPAAIAMARHVLESSTCFPQHIVPTVRGGIQFEWIHAGYDFEIEFNESGEVGLLAWDTSGDNNHYVELHMNVRAMTGSLR